MPTPGYLMIPQSHELEILFGNRGNHEGLRKIKVDLISFAWSQW